MARKKSDGDTAGIKDNVAVEVKGPDPEVWGEQPAESNEPFSYPEGVKGPDPEVWGEEHAAPAG